MVRIYIRDAQRHRIAEIVDHTKLEVIERFRGVGTWSLVLSADSRSASLLVPGSGIIVERHGQPLVSGPVRGVSYARSEDDGPSGVATIKGVSDTTVLAERLCFPVPSATVENQTDATYKLTGAGETVMRSLVNAQAGPAAQADRVTSGLILETDQARGASVVSETRFDVLFDELVKVATNAGLGFRVVQEGTDLQFQVYEPRDLSATARFSFGLGNLRSYSYKTEAPETTFLVIGAGEEGAARVFQGFTRADPLYPNLRIEQFQDRRDLGDGTATDFQQQMDETANETLTDGEGTASLSLEPLDTPRLSYGRDYRVGDTVTIELSSASSVSDVIREVHFTVDSGSGEQFRPVVGNESASETPGLYKRVASLVKRIHHLETR